MKAFYPVIGAFVLLSAAGAQAQTFKEIMEDIGLQKRETPKMDFSERAPLVIPPSTDALPPPEDSSALASANPNWPSDPEVAAALEEAEKDKVPYRLRKKHQDNPGKAIYKIRADERAAREAGETPLPSQSYDTIFDRNTVMTPEQLKEVQERQKNAPAVNVYVEPERRRLTDPPPGYRMPSADQPYGPGQEKKGKTWMQKLNPFDE